MLAGKERRNGRPRGPLRQSGALRSLPGGAPTHARFTASPPPAAAGKRAGPRPAGRAAPPAHPRRARMLLPPGSAWGPRGTGRERRRLPKNSETGGGKLRKAKAVFSLVAGPRSSAAGRRGAGGLSPRQEAPWAPGTTQRCPASDRGSRASGSCPGASWGEDVICSSEWADSRNRIADIWRGGRRVPARLNRGFLHSRCGSAAIFLSKGSRLKCPGRLKSIPV